MYKLLLKTHACPLPVGLSRSVGMLGAAHHVLACQVILEPHHNANQNVLVTLNAQVIWHV